jgi:hypothetical protein
VTDTELERGIAANAAVDLLTDIARRSGCRSLW